MAEQPWFEWVADQLEWPPGGDVLEVGCGSGLLWANIAPLLPELRLTLTDISEGMLDAATAAVAPFANVDLVEARTADAQELPFEDDSFDVVVANHMLYHVPDRPRALDELARILRTDGVLMAATNGPRHLEQVSKASREVFGWATMDFVDRRFGRSTRRRSPRMSRSPTWNGAPIQSALVCDEPEDVYNFIASSSTDAASDGAADAGITQRHQADVRGGWRRVQIGDRLRLLPGETTASLTGRGVGA